MGRNVQQSDGFMGAPPCDKNQAGMPGGHDLLQQRCDPCIRKRLVSILAKGGKGSVIVQQENRLASLSYVEKEILQVEFGNGVKHVLLLLLRQKSHHQPAEVLTSTFSAVFPDATTRTSQSCPIKSPAQR